MTSPGDTSSSSSNPAHSTTATTRRRSDSPDYPASKKRRRTFTADDRAQHRVIEKQRREALNEKFIDLARLLPNLAHVRRLSKGLIVDASIAHHKRQRAQRLLAAQEVRLLLEERDGLYKEVETLRAKLKEPPANAAPKRPDMRPETKQILAVEEEVCGTFPAGFGDNGPEDGQEDGENGDSDMRGSRSPERDVSGREVAAKESGKAISTRREVSAGREGGSTRKEGNGSAGKEARGSSTREAQTASMQEAQTASMKEAQTASMKEAQTASMSEAEPTSTTEAVKEAGFPNEDFAMDLSPSDIRILADDATRMLEHDATRMLEDDAARMLQDDPFMNPLAPSAALTDEDLLALLSADITLNLGDDRPSSIPQVYPDKAGVSPSTLALSSPSHSHNLSSSPHGLSSPPGFPSLSMSPPHHLTAPPDLSPSQIEDLWRQLGSVEIPDLGAGAGSAGPHPSGGQRIPNRQGSGRGASTRAGQAGQHLPTGHGFRDANGHGFRDGNGQHIPGLPPTDDLFGLTANLSTTPVAGSMFGY